MKKRLIYTFMAILGLLSSCNDFLDVDPREQIKQDVLFLTEDGYKTALNGVYIMMANEELYGKNTTMYLPELLCRSWILPSETNELEYSLSSFDFTTEKADDHLNTIWSNYYRCVTQLNSILEAIEKPVPAFEYNNDKLIKGEALGLRAFLQFDVLRFWGPSPSLASDGDIAVPYVKVVTKDPAKLVSLTYGEAIKLIEEDLNAAENILQNIDPILKFKLSDLISINSSKPIMGDKWHYYRQNRFNYYAVLATKARFYYWIGNKEKAIEYARKIIEAKNEDGTEKFKLADDKSYEGAVNVANMNMIMLSESVFAIHSADQQKIIEPLFKGDKPKLTQTPARLNIAYETSTSSSDIRKVERYWTTRPSAHSLEVNYFRKYSGIETIPSKNMVPLIRMAEMYFILMEYMPLAEAKEYFKTFRIARNMSPTIDNSLITEADILLRLEKEYRKDFLGEGQMFFFYKKHGYLKYTWPSNYTLPNGIASYVIPKPKSQSKFE